MGEAKKLSAKRPSRECSAKCSLEEEEQEEEDAFIGVHGVYRMLRISGRISLFSGVMEDTSILLSSRIVVKPDASTT